MTVRVDQARRSRFGTRDIAGLIQIYEASYQRLAKLIPDLEGCDRVMISRVAGALDLYLELIERQPYTTTLVLTYRFAEDGRYALEPNARIHLYHDVRAAEVVSHRPALATCRPSMDFRPHAGAGPKVGHEPLPAEVAEILHVPGTYIHSRRHADTWWIRARRPIRDSVAPAPSHRLTGPGRAGRRDRPPRAAAEQVRTTRLLQRRGPGGRSTAVRRASLHRIGWTCRSRPSGSAGALPATCRRGGPSVRIHRLHSVRNRDGSAPAACVRSGAWAGVPRRCS